MVRYNKNIAIPQKRRRISFSIYRSTPTRFTTIDASSYQWGWTIERSNCAPRVIRGLVIAIFYPLDSSRELSLSGSFDAIFRWLILLGLNKLEESLLLFSGLSGVTFRELLESCSTVLSATYLFPLLRREDIKGFLSLLNYYSFTDFSPLSLNSTYRTLFFPVLFLKAVARILASVLAPRDSLMRRYKPNLVRSMYSSQSMEYYGEIYMFYWKRALWSSLKVSMQMPGSSWKLPSSDITSSTLQISSPSGSCSRRREGGSLAIAFRVRFEQKLGLKLARQKSREQLVQVKMSFTHSSVIHSLLQDTFLLSWSEGRYIGRGQTSPHSWDSAFACCAWRYD